MLKLFFQDLVFNLEKSKTFQLMRIILSYPETPYALHKQTTENMYQFYNRQYDIDTVVFRIANPYGPRGQIKHSKYTIVNFFIRQALEGKTISIFGEGSNYVIIFLLKT